MTESYASFLPAPWSVSDVQAERAQVSYQRACRVIRRLDLYILGGGVLGLGGFLSALSVLINGHVVLGLILASLGMVAWGAMSYAVNLSRQHRSLEDLDATSSLVVQDLLTTIPGGKAYWQAVLEQDRRFTGQDLAVVMLAHGRWQASQKQRWVSGQAHDRMVLQTSLNLG